MRTIIILILLLLFGNLISQESLVTERLYHTSRIADSPPKIDGYINDECWQDVQWSGDFIQKSPYEYSKPSQETAFKILYDDNNIYVAIRAYDSEPDKIEKRLSRRDSFEGDWVAVCFDSYNDNRTGFNFYVTAAGVKADVINTSDTRTDNTWDPVWYVKVSSDELGWVAEMRIPLTQLRFARIDEHVWGLEVMRRLFRKQELSVWQMIPQDASGWVSLWGTLEGINNINPKKEIELIPYAMGSLKSSQKIEGDPFNTGREFGYNAGLDGKIAVTNDLTLNFTINPDFGQVEADPSEVNLSAFESFFPEKRPFFIEGSDIFNFPLKGGGDITNLFYSRRIGRRPHYYPELYDNEYASTPEFTRILGAFKLSGKTRNGWSVGIMESITNNEFAIIDSVGTRKEEAVEPLTNFFNVRLQKEINNGNTLIGGMVTATNRFINDNHLKFLADAAYTGGIDFTQYWKDKNYYIATKLHYSDIRGDTSAITRVQTAPQRYYQRPDMEHRTVDSSLTSISGTGGNIEGGKLGGGNWRYGVRLWWLSPGIDVNDMGFMQRADAISQSTWVRYIIWEPFSVFRNMNFNFSQWSWLDFSGRYLNFGARINTYAQFNNYWSLSVGIMRNLKDVNRSELRGGPSLVYPQSWRTWLNIHSDSRKKLMGSVSGTYSIGDNHAENFWRVGVGIVYRPINSVKLSVNPSYYENYNIAKYVSSFDIADSILYLVGSLNRSVFSLDFRINYSITPDLSLQYWGQPFLYTANYSKYAEVVDAGNMVIKDQYYEYTDNEISYDSELDEYEVNSGSGANYAFENPDFSVFEFRSNLVLRWEYIPGSTAYLVWSQGRSGNTPTGNFSFDEHISNLVDVNPTNIIMLKISYRLSI